MWLKERLIAILCLFLLIIPLLSVGSDVFGQTVTTTPTPTPTTSASDDSKLSSLQDQIREYEGKINDLQSQSKTLSSQIQIMDNQISLSELRIAETKERIDGLQKDIGITKTKISQIETNLDDSTQAMIGRVVAVYEVGKTDPWQMFLTSNDITSFLNRLKYLKLVQMYDKRAIYAAEQNKVNYATQQEILKKDETEEEALKNQLEEYNTQLETDKTAKQTLLAQTKNSEKEYQRRLADSLRELQQIQKAAKVLISTEPRDVKKGEPIGLMGNTGYSFGAHLHFGVYAISSLSQYNYYSSHESPANVLSSQTVNWSTGCGSDPSGATATGNGSFGWPMSTGSLRITQNYGHTCYSDTYYRGNPHPAFDMYNNSDIVVRAADDGKAYFCHNCTGDGANGVFLFHSNGKMTLYWHLQ